MSREYEQELLDVAKWWHEHVDDAKDPMQNMKFNKKSMDMILWLLGRVAQDLQRIEGRIPGDVTHKARTIDDLEEHKEKTIITLDQLTRAGGRHV